MAQTSSDNPRQTDPRAQVLRGTDAARDLAALDAGGGADTGSLDLTEQIEALLGEIEQASAAADPWGDAPQRAAERAAEERERTVEPSQKLLAKVRDAAAMSGVTPGALISDDGADPVPPSPQAATPAVFDDAAEPATATAASVPVAAANDAQDGFPGEPGSQAIDALDEALEAALNESDSSTSPEVPALAGDAVPAPLEAPAPAPSSPEPPDAATQAVITTPHAAEQAVDEASTLAAELDAALKEAGDALERIVPPEDPPAQLEANSAGNEQVPAAAAERVEPALAAPSQPDSASPHESAKPNTVKAHWTNSGGAPATPPPVDAPAETPAAEAAPAAELNAEDLDSALAAQAEELEEASRAAEAPPPASAPLEEAPALEPSGAAAELATEAPSEAVPSPSAAAHATQAAPAPASAHATMGATSNATRAPAAHATTAQPAPAAAEAKKQPAWAALRPLLAKVKAPVRKAGDLIAAPLALLPVSARDIVAYLAAVTIFNAAAVWAYMLFIHQPVLPPPAHDAPALHSTEPAPKSHGDPHAEGATGGHDAGHGDDHVASASHSSSGHEPAGHGASDDHAAPGKHAPEHETTPAAHPAPSEGHGASEAAHGTAHGEPEPH